MYRLIAAVTVLSLLPALLLGLPQSAKSESGRLLAASRAKKPVLPAHEPLILLETSRGVIKILLYRKDAPITAGNFLDLVQKGFYNGLAFHRYEPGFLIQGGDPRGSGEGVYVDPATNNVRSIPLEIKNNLRHSEAGMLAMARAGAPDSASCQFYLTLAACPQLDDKYAVFGKVIDGLPVLMSLRKGDKIVKATATETPGK